MKNGVECWWCSSVNGGHPLYMDPIDNDTDNDGTLDNLDAFPDDNPETGEMLWTGRSCTDPASVVIFDPEFNEADDLVTWIADQNPYDVKLFVTAIDAYGDFDIANAIQVDHGTDVLSISANIANGPEWVYHDGGKGMAILYTKLVYSTNTIHWAYDNSGWTVASLGVEGRSPFGTLATTSIQGGAVVYFRGASSSIDHFYCELGVYGTGCAGSEVEAWPVSLSPPEGFRFAEVDSDPPTLVGVDYTHGTPYNLMEWTEAGGDVAITSGSPNKHTGWKWTSSAASQDLIATTVQIFASPATGPGLIEIYDTGGDLWQKIPVGRNDYPYIGSVEPFVDHDGTSWLIFAASTGKYPVDHMPSRVIIAEVSATRVTTNDGVDSSLVIRQIDAGIENDAKLWKDPEGYQDGSNSWVYMKGWYGYPRYEYDTTRCLSGI